MTRVRPVLPQFAEDDVDDEVDDFVSGRDKVNRRRLRRQVALALLLPLPAMCRPTQLAR